MATVAPQADGDGALFLGLDVGTQGTKALLWDATARAVVGRGARAHAARRPLGQ